MPDRFPDYDVLAKRTSPSWNDKTREVIDQRLSMPESCDALTEQQQATLRLVIDRVVPQPEDRASVNAFALLAAKIAANKSDGFRHHRLPPVREAWQRGLDAIDAEAKAHFDTPFAQLDAAQADAILSMVQQEKVTLAQWADIPAELFWSWRLIPDIVSAYYAHPSAWSAMGFGGPASPRGYVRLQKNRRDPWEAAEADSGILISAKRKNRHVV